MKIPLKQLRDSAGITQAEFSEIMNVSPAAVGLWEQGRREPGYGVLVDIANYFGVTTDYLLGREEQQALPKPQPPPLTREETKILNLFRNLTDNGKQALVALASQMRTNPRQPELATR